ncbi:hypothetical protein WEH80_31005 [Actinomycetes bacterium KLBMP 9759]
MIEGRRRAARTALAAAVLAAGIGLVAPAAASAAPGRVAAQAEAARPCGKSEDGTHFYWVNCAPQNYKKIWVYPHSGDRYSRCVPPRGGELGFHKYTTRDIESANETCG